MLFRPWKTSHTTDISTLFKGRTLWVRCVQYLEGHVGDVNQLVVAEVQHVEEAELCEGSRLNLFHTVVVQMQLLQGGEPVKGFLRSDTAQSGRE